MSQTIQERKEYAQKYVKTHDVKLPENWEEVQVPQIIADRLGITSTRNQNLEHYKMFVDTTTNQYVFYCYASRLKRVKRPHEKISQALNGRKQRKNLKKEKNPNDWCRDKLTTKTSRNEVFWNYVPEQFSEKAERETFSSFFILFFAPQNWNQSQLEIKTEISQENDSDQYEMRYLNFEQVDASYSTTPFFTLSDASQDEENFVSVDFFGCYNYSYN